MIQRGREFISGAEGWIRQHLSGGVPKPPIVLAPPVLDLSELRAEYEGLMVTKAFETVDPIPASIRQLTSDGLRRVERQIVSATTDPLKAQFLAIYCQQDFDLRDIFRAEDQGDWTKPIQDECKSIAAMLGCEPKRTYYSFARREDRPVPYTGQKLLSWLLSLAQNSPPDQNPLHFMFGELKKSRDAGIWCGEPADQLGIDPSELLDPASIFISRTAVFIGDRTYSPPMTLLTGVAARVPQGKEWLDEIIAKTEKKEEV